MARKWIYLVGGIAAFVVLLLLLLPFLVDVNSYRPKIETMMTSALGRKVTLGTIHLSLFAGGVSVEDVTILDDPAFETGDFVTAKSITVGVKLIPLIFSHSLQVTGLTVEEPQVTLLRSSSGVWNFSSIGGGASQPAAGATSSSSPGVSVDRLRINNGKLFIDESGGKGKKRECDQLNLEVTDLSYTTQFPFQFSAQLPGNGTVKLTGKVGPLNQGNMEQTPVQASLEVKGLDLTSSGFAGPSSGLAGIVDLMADLNSDGTTVHAKGTATATKLQMAPGGSPATEPVTLDFDTNYQTKPQTGTIDQCDVHIGKAVAKLTGTYNTSGETPSVQTKLTGNNMPVADLASVLPALNVTLPAGASLTEGTLTINLASSGPVDRLVTTGPVNLTNAKLTGFDIGSKMGALSSFAGVPKSSDTVIQTFSSDVRVAPEGIKTDKLDLVVQGVGTITGSGTMSADRDLDYKMMAQLSGSASPLGGLSKIAGAGQKGGGVPFFVRGTASNPQFVPDMAGMMGGLAKGIPGIGAGATSGVKDVGGTLGGLFGNKKK